MTIEKLSEDLKSRYGYAVYPAKNKNQDYTHTIFDENTSYFAKISFESGSLTFNGSVYEDIDILVSDIKAFNDSLPFVADYYCPEFNISARTSNAIDSYLKKIGLELTTIGYNCIYMLKDIYGRGIITVNFEMDDCFTKESGVIYEMTPKDSNFVFSRFKNAEDAVGIINSMIESKCLVDIAKEINVLDKISDKRKYDLLKMRDGENDTEIDLKKTIKNKMQEIINSL